MLFFYTDKDNCHVACLIKFHSFISFSASQIRCDKSTKLQFWNWQQGEYTMTGWVGQIRRPLPVTPGQRTLDIYTCFSSLATLQASLPIAFQRVLPKASASVYEHHFASVTPEACFYLSQLWLPLKKTFGFQYILYFKYSQRLVWLIRRLWNGGILERIFWLAELVENGGCVCGGSFVLCDKVSLCIHDCCSGTYCVAQAGL